MPFDVSHFWLITMWLIYYGLHSLLAASSLKKNIQQKVPQYFPFYRITYSSFFFITLVGILFYQWRMDSPRLFTSNILSYGIGIPAAFTGLTIMGFCIRKYFYNLSGVAVFYQKSQSKNTTLELGGLHRYMRHPLYSGTLLFAWALVMLFPFWSYLIMAALMTLYVLVGIQLEEKKLLAEFGEPYRNYRARTAMLIPGII